MAFKRNTATASPGDLVAYMGASRPWHHPDQVMTMHALARRYVSGQWDLNLAAKLLYPLVTRAASDFRAMHPGAKFETGVLKHVASMWAGWFVYCAENRQWDALGPAAADVLLTM